MRNLVRFAALLIHCALAFFRSHRDKAIVDLALRQQLAVYDPKRPRPKLSPLDRAFMGREITATATLEEPPCRRSPRDRGPLASPKFLFGDKNPGNGLQWPSPACYLEIMSRPSATDSRLVRPIGSTNPVALSVSSRCSACARRRATRGALLRAPPNELPGTIGSAPRPNQPGNGSAVRVCDPSDPPSLPRSR